LNETLAALSPGVALVEWAAAAGELVAFVLRDGRATVVRGLCRLDEVAARVPRVAFQIGRALAAGPAAMAEPRGDRLLADVRRELGIVHDLVMAPLRPLLAGADRLVLVPHGPMHALPLHALWNGEGWLVERCAVAYAPSAGVLAHLGSAAPRPSGSPLVVGVADEAAPLIADEAAVIARALPAGDLLLGAAATVDRVTAAAEQAGIVHLATHGRFLPGDPLASGLKLSDRWLTVRDVYRLRLRSALVVLAGCETGRAAVEAGDEVLGLVRGFLAAGASALLIGQWLVDDAATTDLMTGFYRAYLAGAPPAAALRDAQLATMRRLPHPAFWAPFTFAGAP
jgi:CHAT domain-containing protein